MDVIFSKYLLLYYIHLKNMTEFETLLHLLIENCYPELGIKFVEIDTELKDFDNYINNVLFII